MKRVLFLIIVLIIFGACAKQSELTIYNDTGQSIRVILDNTIHQLYPNDPPAVETYYLNSFILFGETVDAPIIIEGQIYLEHKEFVMKMKPNKDRWYHVELDRAGLQVSNVSLFPLSTIQLRAEGDEEWSDNILTEILYTETMSPTISIIPDYDYIKMIDIFDTEYQEEIIELNAGETATFIFFGS